MSTMLHESNSFSPLPTRIEDFDHLLDAARDAGDDASPSGSHDLVVRWVCQAAKHQVIDGIHVAAVPSAPASQIAYEDLRGQLLDRLKGAGAIDMVLLFLHGAQMAEACEDCEGDIIGEIRAVVGQNVPIGVLLDLHCSLSPRMIDNADVIVACKEYPHTDFPECARNLERLTAAAAKRSVHPVLYHRPVPLLGFFHTTRDPMAAFVRYVRSLEGKNGILSISLAHGFPAGDSSNAGAGVLVVSDGDSHAAEALADELAAEFFALREKISAPALSLDEAIDKALSERRFPAVVADVADNPGGGAPGDSTEVLRLLLERKLSKVALASLWDPVAFEHVCRAGVGATIPLRLGAKVGRLSGTPVDCLADVRSISDSTIQVTFGSPEEMGPTARIRVEGVDVIVAKRRIQVMSPDVFVCHGIELADYEILVVKSAHHFVHEFSKVSGDIIHASTTGYIGNDFSLYPYRRIRRPIWPLDDTPFTAFGRHWR